MRPKYASKAITNIKKKLGILGDSGSPGKGAAGEPKTPRKRKGKEAAADGDDDDDDEGFESIDNTPTKKHRGVPEKKEAKDQIVKFENEFFDASRGW